MDRYLGSKCPYCKKEFQPSEDVVVCPDCGTPHHRACWKEHGACAHQSRHGFYDWKPELPLQTAVPDQSDVRCPNCGAPLAADARFCPSCGTTFGGADLAGRPSFFGGAYAGTAGMPGAAPVSSETRAFGAEEPVGDLHARDYAAFVGKNQRYFLPRFKLFSEGRHNSFNVAAFLFGYLYLFYRKMYGLGIAVFLLTLLLDVPSLAASYVSFQQALIDAGALSGAIFAAPDAGLLSTLSMVGSVLIWGVKACLLFFIDRYYYRFCTDRIHSLREVYQDGGFYEAGLLRKGGTSMAAAVLSVILIALASYLPFYLLISSPLFNLNKFMEFAAAYGMV